MTDTTVKLYKIKEFIMANLPIYLTLGSNSQGKRNVGVPTTRVIGAGKGGSKEHPNAGTKIIRQNR